MSSVIRENTELGNRIIARCTNPAYVRILAVYAGAALCMSRWLRNDFTSLIQIKVPGFPKTVNVSQGRSSFEAFIYLWLSDASLILMKSSWIHAKRSESEGESVLIKYENTSVLPLDERKKANMLTLCTIESRLCWLITFDHPFHWFVR